MSFFGKQKQEQPRVVEGAFEVDYQDNAVLLYRWTNDGERIDVGHVKYDQEHNKVEVKLGVYSVHLPLSTAKMFFGAAAELVEYVFSELTHGKKPGEIKWLGPK